MNSLIRLLRVLDNRILRHGYVEFCMWIGQHEREEGECAESGCTQRGAPCFYPDNPYGHGPDVFYCYEHIRRSGFCSGCGRFRGGIESFDFDPNNFCDDCRYNPDITGDWGEYDRDMDESDPFEEEAYY